MTNGFEAYQDKLSIKCNKAKKQLLNHVEGDAKEMPLGFIITFAILLVVEVGGVFMISGLEKNNKNQNLLKPLILASAPLAITMGAAVFGAKYYGVRGKKEELQQKYNNLLQQFQDDLAQLNQNNHIALNDLHRANDDQNGNSQSNENN